jgi:hypothetical protein
MRFEQTGQTAKPPRWQVGEVSAPSGQDAQRPHVLKRDLDSVGKDTILSEICENSEGAEDDRSEQILGPRYIPTAPCYVCSKNAQCIAEKRGFFDGWRVTKTE